MHQEAGTCHHAIELVVLLANGHRTLAHVHVHHMPCPRLHGHHRKRAGVGKQVEHFQACARLHMSAYPTTALGHVEEQAVVLPLEHMHPIAGTVFVHHVRFGHLACHEPSFGLAGVAALEHPVQRLIGCQLLPAFSQGLVRHSKFFFGHGLKTGQHPYRRKDIECPLFAAGV